MNATIGVVGGTTVPQELVKQIVSDQEASEGQLTTEQAQAAYEQLQKRKIGGKIIPEDRIVLVNSTLNRKARRANRPKRKKPRKLK